MVIHPLPSVISDLLLQGRNLTNIVRKILYRRIGDYYWLSIWNLDPINYKAVLYWIDFILFSLFRMYCNNFRCQWLWWSIPATLQCSDYNDGSLWCSDQLLLILFHFPIVDFNLFSNFWHSAVTAFLWARIWCSDGRLWFVTLHLNSNV